MNFNPLNRPVHVERITIKHRQTGELQVVELTINVDAILASLGQKALTNKSGKSSDGCVTVKKVKTRHAN